MTSYSEKDIVLVDFEYTEGTGSKKRPALVISSDRYNKSRQEIIVLAITSNIKRVLFADTRIIHWEKAGLLFPSVVTGIIRTIKNSMINRVLGTLTESDYETVKGNLKQSICD